MGFLVRLRASLVLAGAVLGAAACSADPQELIDRGNAYFEQEKYQEAAIEFRRAIQADAEAGMAHLRLADTYRRLDDLNRAAVEYVLAAQLLPTSLEAQIQAADMLLAARKFPEAQAVARRALQIDPKNIRALVINARSLAGLKRHDQAMAVLERAIELDPTRAATIGDLGLLRLNEAAPEETERILRRATETDPASIDARLTLANFYWVQGRLLDAEGELNAALRIDPKSVAANRAMATFFLGTQRVRAAESHLVTAVEGLGTTVARLTLADYYLSLGRSSDAERVLQVVASQPDGFGEARSRLAVLAYSAGRTKEAHQLLDDTLKSDRSNARALLTKAGFLLSENDPDRAFTLATAAMNADPDALPPRYMLASIHRMRRDLAAAERLYLEILRINPHSVAAQLELANLEMSRGSHKSATTAAEIAARSRPDRIESQIMLLRSLIGAGDLGRADAVLRPLLQDYGDRAIVQWMAGVLQLGRRNHAAARTHFERALVIQPDAIEPLDHLVALDLGSGRTAAARARVDAHLARMPRHVGLLMLAARTYSFSRDYAAAERTLKTALEVDPQEPAIYDELARVYAGQKQLDRAITEFTAMARANPKAVGPRTMLGVIMSEMDKPFEARAWFEEGLAIDPRNAIIANSLAWLYADQGGDLNEALRLALLAREQIQDRPEVDDTLGFVYYKRDEVGQALPILRSVVERAPQNPIYQYHFGLAHAKAGNRGQAREALEEALRLNPKFPGANTAKAMLNGLR